MKNLGIVLVVLILCGTVLHNAINKIDLDKTPKFKIGECLYRDFEDAERWEKNDVTIKIIEIGKQKYLYKILTPKKMENAIVDNYFYVIHNLYKQMDCPNE